MRIGVAARLFVALIPACCGLLPAADWPTWGFDPQRTGWAFQETTFTTENVANLELKWKAQVKNEPKSLTALTAPVVATRVGTALGIKTVVYVAGSDNHLFALDAETGSVIWSRTFETHVSPKNPGMWLCPNGINATPTIDRTRNMIFVIAFDGRVFGLDLGTGDIHYGPVQFVPAFSKNWSLNLQDGVLYTALSQGCGGAPSGISSLDTRDPMQPAVRHLYISKRFGAGIWGRGGAAIGKNGLIYASTGDGPFNPPSGEYGSSYVAATMPDLKLADYYTPLNWDHINRYDLDMSSGGPVWLAYRDYSLLVSGGKEGVVYVMDAGSLGDKDHYTPLYITPRLSNDGNEFQGAGVWGAPSAWSDGDGQPYVYIPVWGKPSKNAPQFPHSYGPTPHGSLMAFKVVIDNTSKKPVLAPAWISHDLNLPDPPALANGVLFVVSTGENPLQTLQGGVIQPNLTLLTDQQRTVNTDRAVLFALDAKTGKVLYDSGNAMTTWVHFSGLAVADGRVFAVDHDSNVYCFGLKKK